MTDITAILNVHEEGRLCVPSFRSMLAAAAKATAAGLSVEVYVVADRNDRATLAALQGVDPDADILFVDHGDLGLARNVGVSVAEGKYVAFLDADDLWGESWLVDAWTERPKHDNFVAHPQWWVSFTTTNTQMQVHEHIGMDDARYNPHSLLQFNPWTALCFAPREVLKEYPYKARGPGTGFEDWQFNATTAAAGIQHVAIPNTIHFIRHGRPQSLSIELTAKHSVPGALKYFERRPDINAPIINNPPMSSIDYSWLGTCIAEANALEPRLWPLPQPLRTWTLPKPRCAEPFWSMQECRGAKANYVVFTPKLGGALMKDAIQQVNLFLKSDDDDKSVTVIVTSDVAPPGAEIQALKTELAGVKVICMAHLWGGLIPSERIFLMQRFVTQNRPGYILILDEPWTTAALQLNPQAITHFSAVVYYVGEPVLFESRWVSPGLVALPDFFDSMNAVVCESAGLRASLAKAYGLPEKRMLVISPSS